MGHRRIARGERGQSLIETMVAMAILAVGLLGALGGIAIASRQNSYANRISRATTISEQVRAALQVQGFTRLTGANGILSNAYCGGGAITDSTGADLTHGLNALPAAHCVADVDAYDAAIAGTDKTLVLVPGYPTNDKGLYRRVLVYFSGDASNPNVAQISVVVSWLGPLGREFSVQTMATYDPAATKSNSQI